MSKTFYLKAAAAPGVRRGVSRPVRHAAARALGAASMLLGRLSAAMSASEARVTRALPPVLEFYADAAAPEGALYLNGELVGILRGVTRL